MAYENERVYGTDDLNNVPKNKKWNMGGTVWLTVVDDESHILKPKLNGK